MIEAPHFLFERSKMALDPLSNVISFLRPHDCLAAGLDAGGDWSIRFERHAGLKCNAVLKGGCWLAVEGVEAPLWLGTGDCVILPRGRAFLLSARQGGSAADAAEIYAPVGHGHTAVFNGGGDFFMTSSRFLISGTVAETLLSTIPPVVLVRSDKEREAVRWSVERIAEELRNPQPGSAASIEYLSHFVLAQLMRAHLSEGRIEPAGWLAAFADPQIYAAVAALHEDPARNWSVTELAGKAGMSRTSFATRFKSRMGISPIGYLTRWRILIASHRLCHTDLSLGQIAHEMGYGSESAFSVAFKRETGKSPRQFAKESRA
ncbi:AraC family transcriptional regulator [Salipiger abyssi]|uniref:AraC family transcriptional regulator n=1 Tax=Salipiger abyssi TaxID=1250539 RepID=UPI001F32F1A1|nr:AraC family transcriptional regulator [Salipiger abyssi]